MRVELYGLAMDSPGVTVYLWSPWRAAQLETRLFDAVRAVPGAEFEPAPDELQLHLGEAKQWRQAVQAIERVLKGWQEEAADAGTERRNWRWLLEADADVNGYDQQNEKSAFWAFVRLSLDRSNPGEGDKVEDVDLNGFGVCFWGQGGE